jgi:hypothetical protein
MNSIIRLYNADKSPKTLLQLAIDTVILSLIVLMVPLLATIIIDGMRWDAADFIIAGLLLFISFFTYKVIALKSNMMYKIATAITVLTALFLIWVNLGVGLVGSGMNIPNLLYGAIPVIGLIGAISVKFKPLGMAMTLFVMALLNTIIALIVVVGNDHYSGESATLQIIMLNGFFIVLWTSAGLLYRNAQKYS